MKVDWTQVPNGIPNPPTRSAEMEARVKKWTRAIRPLIEVDGKAHFCETDADPWTQSYPWAAAKGLEANGLTDVARIWTLHSWAFYGFFKPTEAEVLTQIPEGLLPHVDYYLVIGPDTAEDMNATKPYFDKSFHVAQTVLYSFGRKVAP